MKAFFIAFTFAFIVTSTSTVAQAPVSSNISPTEAIQLAASAAPDGGVKGTFLLTVKATGMDKYRYYLNSELDYRDQRNLTIAIDKSLVRELKLKHGKDFDFDSYFVGKTVLVTGIARRVTIYFGKKIRVMNGKVSNEYYFQTHVPVNSFNQIDIKQ